MKRLVSRVLVVAAFAIFGFAAAPADASYIALGASLESAGMHITVDRGAVPAIMERVRGAAAHYMPVRAWYNSTYGEIGDIGRNSYGYTTVGGVKFGIQRKYSNKYHTCSFSPITSPDGTLWTRPPRSRPSRSLVPQARSIVWLSVPSDEGASHDEKLFGSNTGCIGCNGSGVIGNGSIGGGKDGASLWLTR